MKKILTILGMFGLLSIAAGTVFAAGPAPTITSISPSSGSTAGGTSITIVGTHLDSTTVTIGGSPVTGVVVAGNNLSLTATTPAGSAGAQDVVVASANGTSTLAGGFTYVAPAVCNGSTFDTFTTGTVNGQQGWHVSGDVDQEIVPNTFGYSTFGCKSLRMSDATTSVFIFNQVFSSSTLNTGELGSLDDNGATGTPRNHFDAQFDLASVLQNEQPGMHLSVSPDRGDGTRMSSLGFSDTASGINVFFDDVTGTTTPTTFNETQIATNLSRSVPHTIKFAMDFLEGTSNDIVKIFIDGNLVHTGTSWENFYRYDADAFGGPTPNSSRTVNSLVFYEPGTALPGQKSNGFLIDNIALTSTTTTATSTPSDTTPPVITLTGSSTVNVLANTSYTDAGATANDNVDGNITSNIVTTGLPIDTLATGTFTVHYNVSDAAGNHAAEVTRTVNVNATTTASTTPPVITLNGSSTMNIFLNSTFTDPGATAVDSTNTSIPVIATGTVNTAATGTYTITYTATDSNNLSATTTRTVNVAASSTPSTSTSTFPIITLNGSSTVQILQNTTFSDPGATATDAQDGNVSVTATGTVDTATLGNYVITYSATDSDNNTSTTTRTVSVVGSITTSTPGTGGGGSSSGGGFFVFSPVPGLTTTTFPTNSPSASSPITVVQVSTPTGQVLGVAVFNFKRNMKIGATGDDVQELQKYLISQGYLVLNNPTKYFGAMTLKALKGWQKARGLPSTGYFGPMSRAEILK